MTSQYQAPLLNPSGSDIPSPLFAPRPGWGGQLAAWFRSHAYLITFRTVLILAVVIVGISIYRAGSQSGEALLPTPTASPDELDTISITAAPGQGMTHLAAAAVDTWSSHQNPPALLSPAEHLFAVDTLARAAGWRPVARDESVSFLTAYVAAIVDQATSLSPAQSAAWQRLLK